jgi:membrane protein required for colicin V production
MNYIDIILCIVLVYSVYQGFRKGFIVMVGTLAALLLGIWGAVKFSGFTESFLQDKFGWEYKYNSLIAFAITFIGIVIGVNIVAKLLDKVAESVSLGFMNKLLGIIFATLRNAFIISIVLVILNGIDRTVNFMPKEDMEESILYKPVESLAPWMFPYLSFEKITSAVDVDALKNKKDTEEEKTKNETTGK